MRNVDASIFRDISIYERAKLQIRGDAVNIFNIFNPSNPGLTLNSAASAGLITSGLTQGNAGGARVIQIGGACCGKSLQHVSNIGDHSLAGLP
jgi:hypothetical protein